MRRHVKLPALVALLSACSNLPLPVAPGSIETPSIAPAPLRDPPPFPPVMRPARIFEAVERPVYATMHGGPLASRYVLYDDGSFALQYASANYPFFEYPLGNYTEANGSIALLWKDTRWDATATILGDSLSVHYNEIMHHSDFYDGVYVSDGR